MERSESLGVVMLGMVSAFERIKVISGEKAAYLSRDIDPDRWYPLTQFFDLLDALTAGGRDVSPILFRAGAEFRERAAFGGNRTGKSHLGSFELSLHLTGQYPE